MPLPDNDPSTYFERHPIRIVTSLNSVAVEIWNREMGIPNTEKPASALEKEDDDGSV